MERLKDKTYCLSIGLKDFDKAIKVIQDYDMAEIRLDLCEFDRRQVKAIFASHNNLIATFRKNNRATDQYRLSILKTAIVSGAKWVDVDIDINDDKFIKDITDFALDYNIKIILSKHDYHKTPEINEINTYIQKSEKYKADLIKLVFFARNEQDNKRVLSLYANNKNILAFNMGNTGKPTRIKALELGAPFMYVALEGEKTASGQMTLKEIKNPQL